ncbi:hypothetical protein LguiB_008934 [Lonicera macranthoides]
MGVLTNTVRTPRPLNLCTEPSNRTFLMPHKSPTLLTIEHLRRARPRLGLSGDDKIGNFFLTLQWPFSYCNVHGRDHFSCFPPVPEISNYMVCGRCMKTEFGQKIVRQLN